jgi:2-polyprenyl-6-methoxyphenol hydroxylase-like FAD-dependent oxidoreductase
MGRCYTGLDDPGAPQVPRVIQTKVLIVGGGPVGMTLALDLAWRGIDVVVAERRPADAPPNVKCGQISARSMEVFRRLGVAHKLRAIGLPADYPNDIVSATSVLGIELSRVPIPARGERGTAAAAGPDTAWPTPEHTHRCNQIFFEPVLIAHVAAQPRIRMLNLTEVEKFTQHERGVTAVARDLDSGERISVACAYLVGCDGASSLVRKAIGAELQGTPVLQHANSSYIRAPALKKLLPGRPAWLYYSLNPRRCGVTMAVDGHETWNVQNYSYHGEPDLTGVDRDWAIRMILGAGPEFEIEVLASEDWIARRLVADRFQERRVYICGDAAHLWVPAGGYGMNAGIADAANLAWKLAATLNGWAGPRVLDSYDAERQPITEQASHHIAGAALKVMAQRHEITADIERQDAVGEATRARIGREAYALDVHQQCCGGLNFGYYYEDSPIVADRRVRRRAPARLHDGHVYVLHGSRMPRTPLLAGGPPLTLRHAGDGLHSPSIRSQGTRRRHCRCGPGARCPARRSRRGRIQRARGLPAQARAGTAGSARGVAR